MEYQTKSENGKEKDDLKTSAGKLKESVSDYVKIYAQLAKAKATRGASNAQSRSVYVGAVWQRSAWRIGEIRVMP